MRLDKLTTKSQEALQQAQALAEKRNHQAIDVEHLLFALLGQKEGVVTSLLQKLGVPLGSLTERLQKALDRLPQITGSVGQTYIAPRLKKTIENAEAEAEDKSRASAGAESKGSSASFEHFKVSVTQVSSNSSQLRLQAKVCVKSLPPDPQGNRTRISWDPWSIRAGSRTIEPDVNAAPLEKEFPADATYRVGECASGWIPFATNRTVTRIVYANGVGDRAVWDAANLAAHPTTRRS